MKRIVWQQQQQQQQNDGVNALTDKCLEQSSPLPPAPAPAPAVPPRPAVVALLLGRERSKLND